MEKRLMNKDESLELSRASTALVSGALLMVPPDRVWACLMLASLRAFRIMRDTASDQPDIAAQFTMDAFSEQARIFWGQMEQAEAVIAMEKQGTHQGGVA